MSIRSWKISRRAQTGRSSGLGSPPSTRFASRGVHGPGRGTNITEPGDQESGPTDVSTGSRGSPLRIVHLGKFYHPAHGGIETAIRSLAHAQAMLGCRVQVVCMDHESGRATRVERDGPVVVIRIRRAASLCKLDHCPDLARVLRESDADLLHLHTPNPSMIMALLLSGDKRPLVVSHHSDVIKQRLRRVLFSPMERACYNRARLILAMSPPYVAGSTLLRRYTDRVAVLPIGLDPPGSRSWIRPLEVVERGDLLKAL